jgi:hypothetical protein
MRWKEDDLLGAILLRLCYTKYIHHLKHPVWLFSPFFNSSLDLGPHSREERMCRQVAKGSVTRKYPSYRESDNENNTDSELFQTAVWLKLMKLL